MVQLSLSKLLSSLPSPGTTARLTALGNCAARTPKCGVAQYLLGCELFDQGLPATAVRHMMAAHHADAALESAALLAFAGLHAISRPSPALLPALLETWEEYRRPEFDRTRRERALLDAFTEPLTGLDDLTPLAARLWRLPIRVLRSQIRAAVQEHDVAHFPMLMSPA